MRVLNLACRQVGHWPSSLELTLSPRVTVILGDNEAGKSTLRRAIQALFFRPNQALAAPLPAGRFDMGATILLGGTEQQVQRRGTRDLEGLATGSSPLFLPANAGRFSDLFCLSHETLLPKDFHRFLRADGVLGSLMFAARTGLSPIQLQGARRAVEDSLTALASRKRGGDGFPLAADAYKEGKEKRTDIARFDAIDSAQDGWEKCNAEVMARQRDAKAFEDETKRFRTLLQGIETWEALCEKARELEALTREGIPPPVEDTRDLRVLFDRWQSRTQELEGREEHLSQVAQELAQSDPSGQLHELQSQADALRSIAANLQAEEQSLQEQEAKREDLLAEISSLLGRLGEQASGDVETVAKDFVCAEPIVARMVDLLSVHDELNEALRSKTAIACSASDRSNTLKAELEKAHGLDPAPLEAAAKILNAACDDDAELNRLVRDADQTETQLQQLASALSLAEPAESPSDVKLPNLDQVRAAETLLQKAAKATQEAHIRLVAAKKSHLELSKSLASRRATLGNLPTAEDLAAVRAIRDGHVRSLTSLTQAEPGGREREAMLLDSAQQILALIKQADLLADQRMEAGERLGEVQEAERQFSQSAQDLSEQERAYEAADLRERDCENKIAAHWDFLRFRPRSADEWFGAFADWSQAWSRRRQLQQDCERLREKVRQARSDAVMSIRTIWPEVTRLESVVSLRDAIAAKAAASRDQRTREETLRQQLDQATKDYSDAKAALKTVESSLLAWREDWVAATKGLPSILERDPVTVSKWIELQGELRRRVEELTALTIAVAKRHVSLEDKRASLLALVRSAQEIDPALHVPNNLSPLEAFNLVSEPIAASTTRQQKRVAIEHALSLANHEKERARISCEAALSELRARWIGLALDGDSTLESLEAISRRSTDVEITRGELAVLETRLNAIWGEQRESFIEEIASHGRASLEAICADRLRIEKEGREALEASMDYRRDAQRKLEASRAQSNALQIEQDLADLREDLLEKAGHWQRLLLAKKILDRLHADANDGGDALIDQASEYFRIITGGAYGGLRIDQENPLAPNLVAVDGTGRMEKELGALSAGTHDQIWLSLRLAAIVLAAEETPFPVLLDDALVHFDDTRTRDAFKLLHRVSEKVQIILFTHHDHLATLAESVIPATDLAVIALPEVTGAMRQRNSVGADRRSRMVLETGLGVSPALDSGDGFSPTEAPSARFGSDARDVIVEVLRAASGPLGKAAVLERASALGLDLSSAWNAAIKDLLAEKRVEKEGEKRGAVYFLAMSGP